MNFLALLPIFNTLVDRILPDKEKQEQAKLELQKALNEAEAEQYKADAAKMESQSKVVVAETQSQSYAARNWRPHLMYCLMLTYPVNFVIFPLLRGFGVEIPALQIPSEYWTILTVGLGGYIGNDIVGTYSKNKAHNDKKFFEILKQKIFTQGLTQAQVETINEALKAREDNQDR